jgi:hypothetical protein
MRLLLVDFVLHSIARSLDHYRFGVMQQPVENCRGQRAVIVEGFRALREGLVCRRDDGAAFVALADDLEEQLRAFFVYGEVSQFIDEQDGRFEILA